MSAHEQYRYVWIKVTDRAGRAAASAAEIELMRQLTDEVRAADKKGGKEAKAANRLLDMARTCLGPGIENTIKIVQQRTWGNRLLDIVPSDVHPVSQGGIEISITSMPAGFSRDDSLDWLRDRIGAVWSHGALACRLLHAVSVFDPQASNDTAKKS